MCKSCGYKKSHKEKALNRAKDNVGVKHLSRDAANKK